jgi:hypothetical protein
LFFALISVLDDGIELAIGAHAINNIFNSSVVTFNSSVLPTEALFVQHHVNPYNSALVVVILSLVAIAFFGKKYKWNFKILKKRII